MYVYSSPPLFTLLLSVVSVTNGQPRSENIKWKIPVIINSLVLNSVPSQLCDDILQDPLGTPFIPLSSVSVLYPLSLVTLELARLSEGLSQ